MVGFGKAIMKLSARLARDSKNNEEEAVALYARKTREAHVWSLVSDVHYQRQQHGSPQSVNGAGAMMLRRAGRFALSDARLTRTTRVQRTQ